MDKWTAIVEEEGYEDFEDWSDLTAVSDGEEIDFGPFVQRVFEEVYLPHRPS